MSNAVREERTVPKRATNVSLDAKLVADAQALGINLSRACEEGLAKRISEEKNRRWREENQAATQAYNAYIEKYGLPLGRYRMF